MSKSCFRCKLLLPYDCFFRSKKNSDGYRSTCKQCEKIPAKKTQVKNNRPIDISPKQKIHIEEILPPIDLPKKSSRPALYDDLCLDSVLYQLLDKHQKFISCTFNPNGVSVLQIFSNPRKTYKAESLDALIENIVVEEGL